ncbi:hypothetical protein PPL_08751 [Heterostelium album PN500]|uniref:Methyltransferase type 11 domain-containing protein n=1 Tax=Heterostelium pallidum (strain ATCC 26659 / Pp 5 / PN500) TaxID=670386 RepID=D3BJM3_HETP5|nr:hypothetical protein PPL_08751 [Heterostelium album PN500]EFA78103.1 hypothetical protein PPL_08751 [Heterostelium album PN500]|eukprot:XP_020430230.1 hypothetical protein PPL_08751 [Heterostelium album PN500]
MTKYGEKTYWDSRYKNNTDSFDWYQDYNGLRDTFSSNINKDGKILMVGCGNSLLSEEMNKDGYKMIVNIDISTVIIDQLREKYKNCKGLEYMAANIMETPFKDDFFDFIIDKGTFDAIMCGDNLHSNALQMCEEIYRILKPLGKFILISYGEPDDRLFYLEQEETEWNIEVLEIPKPTTSQQKGVHYVYIMTKQEYQDDDDDDDNEDEEDDDDNSESDTTEDNN